MSRRINARNIIRWLFIVQTSNPFTVNEHNHNKKFKSFPVSFVYYFYWAPAVGINGVVVR